MLDTKRQTGKHTAPYLRNSNIQWNRIEFDDLLQMDFDEKDRREFTLSYGDLLVCEGGEVGRAAIWHNQMPNCYYQKALHRVRPKFDRVTSEYLLFFLWQMALSGGLADFTSVATIAHLTGEKLRQIPVPLPPLELQEEFARVVQNIEVNKAKTQASLASLEKLFASLLQQAFDGGLSLGAGN
jgi:type I restriction enzyme, S subunit